MAQSLISFFVDDAAVTAMTTRVPGATTFNSGVFGGASNSPGIGISTTNPGLEESLPNWTLLDQHGNARNDQIGQLVGGTGITAAADYPSSGGITVAPSTGMGTAPGASIRLMDAADLPTYAEKLADPNVDGNLTLPAFGAELVDLAVGWVESL